MEGGRVYDEVRMTDTIVGRAVQSAMGVRNTWAAAPGLRLSGGLEQQQAWSQGVSVDGGSRAVTIAADWYGQDALKDKVRASSSAEYRDGSHNQSNLYTAALAYKLSRNWSVLTRLSLNRVTGRVDPQSRVVNRQQIGFAYRPVDQDVWNTLMRYERKVDNRTRHDGLLGQNKHTQVISAHLNYQPHWRDQFSARLASRYSTIGQDAWGSRYVANLLHGRWTRQLHDRWDIGLQSGHWFDSRGAHKSTAGTELGYRLAEGLWFSVGYNVVGLRDPELTNADYTDRGAYVRLRFKFDERLFSPSTSPMQAHP